MRLMLQSLTLVKIVDRVLYRTDGVTQVSVVGATIFGVDSGRLNGDELPLFLNAEMVANVLGVSSTICYEMMHAGKLPVLRIGSRLIVPKEKFLQWIEKNTSGGTA